MSFYYLDGRVYSLDGTTDWRLDIWQDSIDYQLENNQFLFGVGYDDLLAIMNDPEGTRDMVMTDLMNMCTTI